MCPILALGTLAILQKCASDLLIRVRLTRLKVRICSQILDTSVCHRLSDSRYSRDTGLLHLAVQEFVTVTLA